MNDDINDFENIEFINFDKDKNNDKNKDNDKNNTEIDNYIIVNPIIKLYNTCIDDKILNSLLRLERLQSCDILIPIDNDYFMNMLSYKDISKDNKEIKKQFYWDIKRSELYINNHFYKDTISIENYKKIYNYIKYKSIEKGTIHNKKWITLLKKILIISSQTGMFPYSKIIFDTLFKHNLHFTSELYSSKEKIPLNSTFKNHIIHIDFDDNDIIITQKRSFYIFSLNQESCNDPQLLMIFNTTFKYNILHEIADIYINVVKI